MGARVALSVLVLLRVLLNVIPSAPLQPCMEGLQAAAIESVVSGSK